jgi:N utilization substance protein B
MRRKSRELALQVLFQREFTAQIDFDQFMNMLDEPVEKEIREYTHKIVDGLTENKEAVDRLIQAASRHWKMERMSVVDRTILRIATYEIRWLKLPPKVAIDEAVEIAKKYGSTDSSAFVNGILDQISKES